MRLNSTKRQHCCPQIRNRGSIAWVAKGKGPPFPQDDHNHLNNGRSCPNLPEDILRHIHSKMQLREAARAACVSRTFRQSWICHPNLDLSNETLTLDGGGSIAWVAKGKGPPFQQDDHNHFDNGISGPNLPEDILRHIHSKMQLREAARAACVSRTFRQSWICHPNLNLSNETLRLDRDVSPDEITRDLIPKIDHILQNRSGISLKTLKLDLSYCDSVDSGYLSKWLHIAVTPGIEELVLWLPPDNETESYNFPCLLLCNGSGSSIRYLDLCHCAFRPIVGLGSLKSLTRLCLYFVRITGDELECIFSTSSALEQLTLVFCDEIICLKIPPLLQRLSFLDVAECENMQMVEINAPNLSTFYFNGSLGRISFGNLLQVKTVRIICSYQANIVCYARTSLFSLLPYVETLTISSPREIVNTPMLPGKFIHLKRLHILFVGMVLSAAYDYLSLVSFLDASPYLETFVLRLTQHRMEHASILGDPCPLRQIPEQRHDKLKSVKITGFCSARSLVELTCHILESTKSLDCLTLDTTSGHVRCSVGKPGKCFPLCRDMLIESNKALSAIRRYIVGKVPSTVKLNVLELCSLCHTVKT